MVRWRRREEQVSDSVCEWIHHEVWDGEEVVSAQTPASVPVELLEAMPQLGDVVLAASGLLAQGLDLLRRKRTSQLRTHRYHDAVRSRLKGQMKKWILKCG